jgi:cobalt-zinc-cadmium resistance protein CzcA
VSLEEGNAYANRMRRLVKSFAEVETVITQHGRPDDGTDPDGFSNVEFFVPLKPFDTWRKGLSKEDLIAEMGNALRKTFPGVTFAFSQYIQDNVQEAASGIDAENAIKITGPTSRSCARSPSRSAACWRRCAASPTSRCRRSWASRPIRIDIDRQKAARYGLSPGDINATIQAAVGGQAAGDLYEEGSDRHFPMMVRLAPRYRENMEALKRIAIGAPGPNGSVVQVPWPRSPISG